MEAIKIIYFAQIHSIMSYGLIFWGNSRGAKKVFLLQKKSSESFQIWDPGIPVGLFSGTRK